MNEAIEVAIVRNKRNKELVLKCMAIVLVVALFNTILFLGTSLFIEPFVSEDVYSFLSSFLFISLSGVLYGLSILYVQAESFSYFKIKVKQEIGPLIITMLLAQFFILVGYVLVFIPGLVLTFLFFLYPYVVTQEEKTHAQALKRSCQLYKYVAFRLPIAIVGLYLLFLVLTASILIVFPHAAMMAEIVGGTVVFLIEVYVFYRLYQRAIKHEKIKKGGVSCD